MSSHPNRARRKAAKRPGRPRLPPGAPRPEKFTTTLPAGYVERLRAIGAGNASAAIVWLVDRWEGDAHVAAERADDYDAEQSELAPPEGSS